MKIIADKFESDWVQSLTYNLDFGCQSGELSVRFNDGVSCYYDLVHYSDVLHVLFTKPVIDFDTQFIAHIKNRYTYFDTSYEIKE